MKPGTYTRLEVSNEAYHNGAGVSKSGLDLVGRSPAHYKAKYLDGIDEVTSDTPAKRFGAAFHLRTLEPEIFEADYAIEFNPSTLPEGALSTADEIKERLASHGAKKSGSKAEITERLRELEPEALFADDYRAAHAEAVKGRTLLSRADAEAIEKMALSVRQHPASAWLFGHSDQRVESSVYWNDPSTGVLVRCRPDLWLPSRRVIVDLKKTRDASLDAFMRDAHRFGYHRQAAQYLEGVSIATGEEYSTFVFVAVEDTPPYAVAVYVAGGEFLALGRREYRRNLDTYAACLKSGRWPGYSEKAQTLDLPPWGYKQLEEMEAAE